MDYKFKNGKYILCKEGVYFALSKQEIPGMMALLMEIQTHSLQGNQENTDLENSHVVRPTDMVDAASVLLSSKS